MQLELFYPGIRTMSWLFFAFTQIMKQNVLIIIEAYGFKFIRIDRCNFLILPSELTISVQRHPT